MNFRRRICYLLALLRIHSPDCEHCNARETSGDEIRKRLEELAWRTQSVVTVDLVLTVQKPAMAESADDAHVLKNGDTQRLIDEVIEELSTEDVRNPSHVYARILRKAIHKHYTLDQLHLSDVLLALHSAGYTTNEKTGLMSLKRPMPTEAELA
jgi:hypothetical protein